MTAVELVVACCTINWKSMMEIAAAAAAVFVAHGNSLADTVECCFAVVAHIVVLARSHSPRYPDSEFLHLPTQRMLEIVLMTAASAYICLGRLLVLHSVD